MSLGNLKASKGEAHISVAATVILHRFLSHYELKFNINILSVTFPAYAIYLLGLNLQFSDKK
jgi:hypothetical protein